jgi:hypothetical protein
MESALLIGFVALYTWLALWAPLSEDFPPLWSDKNRVPRWKLILLHMVFLAAFLGVFGWLTGKESTFPWWSEGGLKHVGTFYGFLVGVFVAMLERLLLYRDRLVNEQGGGCSDLNGNECPRNERKP